MARTDSIDYTNNVGTTNIIKIADDLSSFYFSEVKLKQDGNVISKAECNGTARKLLLL